MTGIDQYIEVFVGKFGYEKQSSSLRYLRFLLEELVRTRNERVADLRSPEMAEVRTILRRVFPCPIESLLPCLCIDGRVLSETVFALPIEAFRTPAADISDALPTAGGRTLRLIEGDFSGEIRRRIREQGKVWVVFDSHTGCAAKGEEMKSASGLPSPDGGLLSDAERKGAIARATEVFFEGRCVATMQVSFDVHTGFLFMGLERDAVLSDERVLREGLTDTVLKALSREGKVLSTAVFAGEGGILADAVRREKQSIGLMRFEKGEYASSMLRFWSAVERMMKESCFAEISEEVRRIFPKSESEETQLRSILLLANALLGSLLNDNGSYRYNAHCETTVVITKLARGPYDTAVPFPVNSRVNGDVAILSFVAGFAASIIRANRSKGQFPEGERTTIESCFGHDQKAFVGSPVPIVLSERVSGGVSSEQTDRLLGIDWESVAWADMSSDEFRQFLGNSSGISSAVIDAFDRLRVRSIELFRPGLSATGNLLTGQLALVPALRDPDGKIVAIIPFLMNGYSERYFEESQREVDS